ncbi:hypothetical protein [Streptomyces sp. NPDC014685]|uniref:hypothetical protein n=1 Tax=Streptomyces sp. NPDC014685 TaxID=3364881 RepID=UPI0036FA51D6
MGAPMPGDGPTRAFLRALLDAIDIPEPATDADTATRNAVLADRAGHAAIALRDVLTGAGRFGPEWITEYLRDRLDETPVTGYRPLDDSSDPEPLPSTGHVVLGRELAAVHEQDRTDYAAAEALRQAEDHRAPGLA